MLSGLPALNDPADPDTYDAAWWGATASHHEALDEAVSVELNLQKFT